MRLPAIFLDVNIPMYAAGKEHPYKAPRAWVMRQVGAGRLAVAIAQLPQFGLGMSFVGGFPRSEVVSGQRL